MSWRSWLAHSLWCIWISGWTEETGGWGGVLDEFLPKSALGVVGDNLGFIGGVIRGQPSDPLEKDISWNFGVGIFGGSSSRVISNFTEKVVWVL